jgi:uncharacterized membrane protein YdjX (TVP38/TMEM64 family)
VHSNRRSLATVLILAAGLSLTWGRVDIDQVHREAAQVPALVAFGLMIVLPLVGCPATLVNLCAGVRFGVAGGLPLVALAIVIHQLMAFQLVRWKPTMFGHLVDPIRKRLPKGSHGSVAVFSALIPGVPYWMQVYSMPLIGLKLRTVLLYCVPLHTIRSLIALIGGDISDHPSTGWLVGLGIYAVVLMSVCAYAGRRIRQKVVKARSRRPAGSLSVQRTHEEVHTGLYAAATGGGK